MFSQKHRNINSFVLTGICEKITKPRETASGEHVCNMKLSVPDQRTGKHDMPHDISLYDGICLAAYAKIRPGDKCRIQGVIKPRLDQYDRPVVRLTALHFEVINDELAENAQHDQDD